MIVCILLYTSYYFLLQANRFLQKPCKTENVNTFRHDSKKKKESILLRAKIHSFFPFRPPKTRLQLSAVSIYAARVNYDFLLLLLNSTLGYFFPAAADLQQILEPWWHGSK